MNNRLTPEEAEALQKLRQFLNHQTPENERHMKKAGRAYVRSELAKEGASA